jgi:hypothetical protein
LLLEPRCTDAASTQAAAALSGLVYEGILPRRGDFQPLTEIQLTVRSMTSETKAVFLHAGYRTAGTWLWSCFRRLNEVTAYYEPLHEMLSTIDSANLATSTADS